MNNFNYILTIDYLDDFMFKLDYYDTDVKDLKHEATTHYRDTLGKSSSATSQIVTELMDMFTGIEGEFGNAKKELLELSKFYARHFGCKLTLEIYRAMLLLTFPLAREIVTIAAEYGENVFTSDMVISNLKGEYGMAATVETSVAKMLRTLYNLQILRRTRKSGVYALNRCTPFNQLGVLATLTAAQAMAKSPVPAKNPCLQGLSFEITHEFADYFTDLDYSSIVGTELWEEFQNSPANFRLRLDENGWSVTSQPLTYVICRNIRRILEDIPRNYDINITDVKEARKNEKRK